jgi:hypothetical protein
MWKMFETPMAKQYTHCDEYIGDSDDGGASSSDRSVNCGDQLSRLQVKDESESPPPAIPWNAFPNEQMAQLPVTPTNVTRIHQEETSSTDDIGDEVEIAKDGIAPRTRRPHRASRPGDLQRGRNRTRHLLRVNSSRRIEAATLEGASQKQVQPEVPKAIPILLIESQQDMGDDSTKAIEGIEAKVGFRRRQCTRPLLRENSSRRIEAATLEGASQKQVQPEAPQVIPPLPLGSQQDMGDDSRKAIEAKVGVRRRQCTRPLFRENSSRRKMVSPAPPAA